VVFSLVGAAVALVALAGYAAHVAGYFFVFDDFALLGQSTQLSLEELVSRPLFGFYRPFVFLATRAEASVFGWTHASGHAASNLLLHLLNAALVAAIAWRLLGSRTASVASGLLFLLSPWSAEAVFWMSGRFDLWGAAGVLTALLAIAATSAGDPADRWSTARGTAVATLGAAVGLFSKEASLTLIVLAPVLLLGAAGPIAWTRAAVGLGAVAAVSIGYLALRVHALSALGGVYGDWWTMVGQAPIAMNLGTFAHAFLLPPAPHDAGWHASGTMALTGPVAAAAVLAVLVAATLGQIRQTLALGAALGIALAPVLWVGLAASASGGGRVLYLPGACFALWAGLGVAVACRRGPLLRHAAVAACAIVAVHHLGSLSYQRQIWVAASDLARQAIDQFQPYVGQTGRVHIRNLPFWFAEGPYVLKSYAFGYYYFPKPVPTVSATAVTLGIVDGRVRPMLRTQEPGAAPPPADPGAVVTFDLGFD
jgi:hypothetical protein